jgi:phage shock protein E
MFKKASKILCFIAFVCFLFGCKESATTTEIEQAELLSRIADDSSPVILDVRSAEEYSRGHIPGAINFSVNDFTGFPDNLNIEKNSEIVVYCESGRRAGMMIKTLENNGYYEARLLTGHMQAWRKAGLKTE